MCAKRAGNRGVVTKLIGQVKTILKESPEELDARTRDQLQRIDSMLSVGRRSEAIYLRPYFVRVKLRFSGGNSSQVLQKPQQIISAHMDEIVKLPPSTSDRPSLLCFVYDKLSVHVRGLKSLGVSAEQYGGLLIAIVMSKLPDNVRLQIARNIKEEIWKIEDLLEMIKTEMRAREASEGNRVMPDSTKKPMLSNRPPFKPEKTPTSSTFLSNQGLQGGEKFTIRCAYCKEFHYSASCPKVVDPAKPKEILQRKNR